MSFTKTTVVVFRLTGHSIESTVCVDVAINMPFALADDGATSRRSNDLPT